MGSSRVGLGCLLVVGAVVILLVLILLPILPGSNDNPAILNLMATIACAPGERAEIDVIVTRDSDGTSYSPDITCIDAEGQRSDGTGKLTIIAIVAFTVPLLLGIALFTIPGRRTQRSSDDLVGSPQDVAAFLNNSPAQASSSASAFSFSAGDTDSDTLVEKLREIEEARREGLISQEEYDRLRQQILDSMG